MMIMLTGSEIRDNRRKYIRELRDNPGRYDQVQGMLTDGDNGRCATGIGCELFGFSVNANDPYSRFEEMLDVESQDIWHLNDLLDYSFTQIAVTLERQWFSGNY